LRRSDVYEVDANTAASNAAVASRGSNETNDGLSPMKHVDTDAHPSMLFDAAASGDCARQGAAQVGGVKGFSDPLVSSADPLELDPATFDPLATLKTLYSDTLCALLTPVTLEPCAPRC
jgi:hypothetical protein